MNGATTNLRPASDTATNRDELSGQLIIKAQLGDDIRKMMIHNEDLTLNGKIPRTAIQLFYFSFL